MATMFTPAIDLFEDDLEEVQEPEGRGDDREIGYVPDAFPDENGTWDAASVATSANAWNAVLGW